MSEVGYPPQTPIEHIEWPPQPDSGPRYIPLDLSAGTIASPLFVLGRTATKIRLNSNAGDASVAPSATTLTDYDTYTILTIDLRGYTAPRVEIYIEWVNALTQNGSVFMIGVGDNVDPTASVKNTFAGYVDGTSFLCRRYGQVGNASTAGTKSAVDKMTLTLDFDGHDHVEGGRVSFAGVDMDTANINTSALNKAWSSQDFAYVYVQTGVYDSTAPPDEEEIEVLAYCRVSDRSPV